MRLAARLSVESGAAIAVFGRGLGSSEIRGVAYTESSQIPRPRRTATTWVGKALTETGWLGLIAFAGLLCWLIVLGWTLWGRRAAPVADRALGAALPGIAALTAAGAAYATILSVRGYSTVLWVLVGVAIAAVYRPDEASTLRQG
jgi:nicotinamide riboside transporter PnuC